MHAGVYTLVQAREHILKVKGVKDGGVVMTNPESTGPLVAKTSKVVFHHYGNQYFLAEVVTAGQSDRTVCVKSSAESKAIKTDKTLNASIAAPATTVELAVVRSTR